MRSSSKKTTDIGERVSVSTKRRGDDLDQASVTSGEDTSPTPDVPTKRSRVTRDFNDPGSSSKGVGSPGTKVKHIPTGRPSRRSRRMDRSLGTPALISHVSFVTPLPASAPDAASTAAPEKENSVVAGIDACDLEEEPCCIARLQKVRALLLKRKMGLRNRWVAMVPVTSLISNN
ncbi:hypothetical protein ACOSQ4_012738 [Xanthoceras sorbifolium]